MIRWVVAFLGVWGICLVGIYVAWLVGLGINCAFASGCLSQLTFRSLFAAVNIKGVVARGTLLAIAFIGIAWFRRRAQ
ncbi:hypothetical protein LMG28140_04684 [Paraburkholderia metrosideri]|jgi:predicted outer membrane lipoprotein|uniref:Uncharacterized protein n=1 Tax=Paraburkholderia metrosideri TaxID=580937 RepID=A0ABM8NY59_9BURK|nr:hypothetical protein LMG28140_04684 [Paraburkholderia metrosideri]